MVYDELNIKIFEASIEEKEILKNLLALYLHDLSEFTADLNIDSQGFFEYDALEQYYEYESLTPLLYKINNEYSGFILLNNPPYAPKDVDYYINEFFILKKFRRKGLAKKVIKKLFDLYPGRYLVLQMLANRPAINFWHKVYIENNIEYSEDTRDLDGEECLYQKFEVFSTDR